jgi:NAD(P)-dependent dehydrogenase (short-subunit alcohol dehydrogenase family)
MYPGHDGVGMASVEFEYGNETAVVTGASSGIGRAIAERFGEAGATVINADVRPDPKDVGAETPTHEAIEAAGGTAEFVECDVSDPDDLEAVVEAARAFGGVDVMVNNAGIHVGGGFLDDDAVTPETFDHLHAVNVRGVYLGTCAAAQDMRDRGVGGCIVNTASISSSQAQWEAAPYESTKGAVKMLTRAGALNLAEHGIRVNAIAPGHIATEFIEGLTDDQQRKAGEGGFIKPVPMGRAGFPKDLDDAVLFLASDAASYVTGELLHVDGGWHVV